MPNDQSILSMPAKIAKISGKSQRLNVFKNVFICVFINNCIKATTTTATQCYTCKWRSRGLPCVIASVAAGVGCAEAVVLMVEADWGWTASEVVAVPAPEAPFSSVLFGLTSRSTSRCRKTRIFSSFWKRHNIRMRKVYDSTVLFLSRSSPA